jgi:hypothetical protein
VTNRRAATVGAFALGVGIAGLGWAWALESLLHARAKDPLLIDWMIPGVAVVVGGALLRWQGRLSAIDVVAALLVAGLVGNVVLGFGASGAFDCQIGAVPDKPKADTVRVAVSAAVADIAEGVSPDAKVRVVVVARHHRANNEEAVEATTYDATYVGSSQATAAELHGGLVLEIARGDGDADVAAFLAALADAQRVTVMPSVTAGAAASQACGTTP